MRMPDRPSILTVTSRALSQLRGMLQARGKPSLGVRLGVRSRGCNGQSYTMEYADTVHTMDEVVRASEDVVLYIDPKALLFLMGLEIDYTQDPLKSGFTFNNPNEKGRCGCGESFHV